jgi:D-alanine-D-alanine ligase
MSQLHVSSAFVALHGGYGENGTIQAILDSAGIPYTSPGAAAGAQAMDKVRAKQLFVRAGLRTPRYEVVAREEARARRAQVHERITRSLRCPLAVKPAAQGSALGITMVDNDSALDAALDTAIALDPCVLVEARIVGTELTAPVLGEGADSICLPLIEIRSKSQSGFYDYPAKYVKNMSDHIIPPRVDEATQVEATGLALAAHRLLRCRGVTRTDMMVDSAGRVYLLEVNAVPGFTETSLVPDAAEAAGISFPELVQRLLEQARTGP